MKKKGFVKFKGSESKGAMHYVEFEGDYVSITRNSSRKVKDINRKATLNVTFGLLSRDFKEVSVSIIEEINHVKKVFNFMKNLKHTHYKEYPDDLVVLKYKL